jgi:hypothetical protein
MTHAEIIELHFETKAGREEYGENQSVGKFGPAEVAKNDWLRSSRVPDEAAKQNRD